MSIARTIPAVGYNLDAQAHNPDSRRGSAHDALDTDRQYTTGRPASIRARRMRR